MGHFQTDAHLPVAGYKLRTNRVVVMPEDLGKLAQSLGGPQALGVFPDSSGRSQTNELVANPLNNTGRTLRSLRTSIEQDDLAFSANISDSKPSSAESTSCASNLNDTMNSGTTMSSIMEMKSLEMIDQLSPEEAMLLEQQEEVREEAQRKTNVTRRKQEIRDVFRRFLKENFGCPLQAWLRYFDKGVPSDGVQMGNFGRALAQIGWGKDKYSMEETFHALDVGRCGEVALEDLDVELARLWHEFRHWNGKTFSGPMDVIQKLGSRGQDGRPIDVDTFVEGLRRYEWQHASEVLLFNALDVEGVGYLTVNQFRWLDGEKKANEEDGAGKRESSLGEGTTKAGDRCLSCSH